MTYIGARFLQTDFQIHSPRDRNWNGQRPEDLIEDASKNNIENARANWAGCIPVFTLTQQWRQAENKPSF